MVKRLKFFFAQLIWVVTAFVMALAVNEFSSPPAVIFPIIAIFFITGFLLNWGSSDETQGKGDNTLVLAGVTGFMWLVYVGAVLIGTAEIGAVVIPLSVILMIPLLALNAFMWDFFGKLKNFRTLNVEQDMDSVEKRKRDRIDSVIRDLSDEDLLRLKHRLMNREIVEDDLEYMLGDDGEIVTMNENRRR